MKKWTTVLLGAILAMSMTACGNGANNSPGNSASTPANAPTEPAVTEPADEVVAEDTLPTAEELLKKVSEAGASLTSYTMDMVMDQNITLDDNGTKQEQNVNMKISSDVISEPFTVYQVINMSSPEMEGTEGMDGMEQYITDDAVYVSVDGEWVNIPDESLGTLREEMKSQTNPQTQFNQLNAIIDDVEVSEEGDYYVLAAKVSGDGVKELAKSYMAQSGSDPQVAAMIEQMDIKSVDMHYTIDKESYYPGEAIVKMDMDMDIENQKVSLVMNMNGKFSNYNKIDEIKIPQEAIDSANSGA